MMRPSWFPDWSGEACAIVAGGPSVTRDIVDSLRGKLRVAVINNSYQLAPWADLLYAADDRWWETFHHNMIFEGLKVSPSISAAKHFGLNYIDLVSTEDPQKHSLSFEPGIIARGGHSGHQLLNLVIQFGVKHIALFGYDFCGEHWHGLHKWPLRNPKNDRLPLWASRIDALCPSLIKHGIEVVNCSSISKLTAYPKMSLAEWVRHDC